MVTRRRALELLGGAALGAAAARSASAADPVERSGFIPIGGVEQWIAMRGASADNPALLFLHGGPGEALSPFRSVSAPWERSLVVVHWDQRGAGKTYGRNPPAPEDMSLERSVQDAIEVAEHVRRVLGKDKIVLAGQSWGSIVGWRTIQARPDLFHAYVGTAQAVSWARSMEGREAAARAAAEAAGDEAALAAMDAAQALALDDPRRLAPLRREWIMPPSDLAFIERQRAYVGDPPFEGDVADWVDGFSFSAQALWADTVGFDAYASGLDVAVPVVVIQGREDHITPPDAARRLVEDLRAPSKAFVLIPGGHFACYTHAEAFAGALEEHVLPLAG